MEIDNQVLKDILKSHISNLESKLEKLDELLHVDLKKEYLNVKNGITKYKQLLRELEEDMNE